MLAALALAAAWARGDEVIREQDDAGRVRVIREVAEDAAGNCVNHGLWQMLSPDGAFVAEGTYKMGLRHGAWRRWLAGADASPALAESLRGFEAPFLSQASFVAGAMTGAWTISDAHGRKCLSIELQGGVREGELQTWSPAGEVLRRETYRRGRLDGAAFAVGDADGRLIHAATWLDGHRLVRSVAYHEGPAVQKRSEGEYLIGPQTTVAADDFWLARLADFHYGRECLPHGPWRQWHANGQLAAEGRYVWGRPMGDFLWRHPNGQKAVAGAYAADGGPKGEWRWWNAEGAQLAARTIGVTGPGGAPAAQTARKTPGGAATTRR